MGDRLLIRKGTVVFPRGVDPTMVDLIVEDGRIGQIGTCLDAVGADVLDATGHLVVPGFVDAHSHADAAVFDPEVQRSLLRQGVTSVIVGQDGVSFSPGDGAYAAAYFRAINGTHPSYHGNSVADLLDTYDGATPVNVGYLLPAGTIRWSALGGIAGPADQCALVAMRDEIDRGMADGALGISTGFDYVPNAYQEVDELTAIIAPVVAAGGLHVAHMRGGYEGNSSIGIREVTELARRTGIRSHISHLHGPTDLLLDLLGEATAAGVELSFDAYPYRRSCTLLSMMLLPPEVVAESIRAIPDPDGLRWAARAQLAAQIERGFLDSYWAHQITFAFVAAAEWAWAEGHSVAEAAHRADIDALELCVQVMVASAMHVNVIFRVSDRRSYGEIARLHDHAGHTAGSDGIFLGSRPHPRARGTFGKYLRVFVRELGIWDWPTAIEHLATRAADRHRLADIGRIAVGARADLALLDPAVVRDGASYIDPLRPGEGVRDVVVSGRVVLRDGELTGANAGRALRPA